MAKLKKAKSDDGDGEAWLGSFADMMCLLLGFFMILYSLSVIDEKKFYEMGKSIASSFKQKKEKPQEQIEQQLSGTQKQVRAFQMLVSILNLGDPQQVAEKIRDAYARASSYEEARRIVEAGLAKKSEKVINLSAEVDDVVKQEGRIELILSESSLFYSGSAELKHDAYAVLDQVGTLLFQAGQEIELEVVGHTDSVPVPKGSPFEDNWMLGYARAAQVAKYLISKGLDAKLIRASSRAHFEPLVPEFDAQGAPLAENMARNRRVEIIMKSQRP